MRYSWYGMFCFAASNLQEATVDTLVELVQYEGFTGATSNLSLHGCGKVGTRECTTPPQIPPFSN
eukprot:4008841-Amphidinium_carterae.1